MTRIGIRAVVAFGAAWWAVGIAWLSRNAAITASFGTDLLPGLVVCGAAFGFTVGPLNGLALHDVPSRLLGSMNALFSTVMFGGGAVGLAVALGMVGDDD